jgi:hypothetical protein
VLVAALRRFLVLLTALAGGTAVIGLAYALLSGTAASRAISIGLYVVGCFFLIAGFFVGNRGPVRFKNEGAPLFGARFMRWATPSEREESLNESAIYVVVGFVLILIGAAADPRYRLL